MKVAPACFEAGTPVLTPDGLRDIDALRVGDLVVARDPESGEVASKHVLALMRTPQRPIVRVRLVSADGRSHSIGATFEHPLWVDGHGFVSAGLLEPGDALGAVRGASTLSVQSLAQDAAIAPTVFNLEVEDFHTYFVGREPVLVHNSYELALQAHKEISWTKNEVLRMSRAFRDNNPDAWVDPKTHDDFRSYDWRVRDQLFKGGYGKPPEDPRSALPIPGQQPTAPQAYGKTGGGGGYGGYGGGGGNGGFGGGGGGGGAFGGGGGGKGPYGYNAGEKFPQPAYVPPPDTRNYDAYNKQMWRIVESGSPLDGRVEAFRELTNLCLAGPCDAATRKKILDYGMTSSDPDIRRLASSVSQSPYDAYTTTRRFEQNLDGSPNYQRIKELLRAKAFMSNPKFAASVNETEIDAELQKLLGADCNTVCAIWNQTLDQVRASPEFQRQIAWMRSDDFMKSLELDPDPERLRRELAKVAVVDPDAAVQLANEISGKRMTRGLSELGPDGFLALNEDQQAAVVARLMAEMDDDPTGAKMPKTPAEVLKVAKRIAKVLKEGFELHRQNPNASSNLAKALHDIVDEPGNARWKAFAARIELLDRNGRLSALGGGLSLIAAANSDDSLTVVAGLLKTVDATESYVKYGMWLNNGKKLSDLKKLSLGLKGLKFLGPIADGIGVYQDWENARKDAASGNVTAEYLDYVLMGLGIVNVGAGLGMFGAIFTASPACPHLALVMLVATLGYVGVKALREQVVDPDEVVFLKKAGVYQDTKSIPALGEGGSGVAVTGGVRIVNPGTSDYKKGDIITGVRVSVSPDPNRALLNRTTTPEQLDAALSKQVPPGATRVVERIPAPDPKPLVKPSSGPSADDQQRQAFANARAKMKQRLTVGDNVPTDADVDAWFQLIATGKARAYDAEVEMDLQKQNFRDVFGREPKPEDGPWLRLRSLEVMWLRDKGELTVDARRKTRNLLTDVPEMRTRAGEKLGTLGQPPSEAEIDAAIKRIREGERIDDITRPPTKR